MKWIDRARAPARHQHERKAGAFLLLLRAPDQAGAAAADERRDVPVNADDLEQVGGVLGVIRRDEDKAERGLAVDLLAQLCRRLAQDALVVGTVTNREAAN
ncbi:MAG: hypothetical protein WDO13_14070 [Verrucomicrobiota bacterium]